MGLHLFLKNMKYISYILITILAIATLTLGTLFLDSLSVSNGFGLVIFLFWFIGVSIVAVINTDVSNY